MAAASRLAGLGVLAAIAGLIQLALCVWGIVLISRLVAAVERASNAYSESLKRKE